jgi:hypothetical protein
LFDSSAVCVTIDTVYVSAVTDSYIWEDIFAGLSLLIPMYVAFQEQKVTESKGKDFFNNK